MSLVAGYSYDNNPKNEDEAMIDHEGGEGGREDLGSLSVCLCVCMSAREREVQSRLLVCALFLCTLSRPLSLSSSSLSLCFLVFWEW